MPALPSDIFVWSRLSEPHGYDFNGSLFRHSAGNLCIDPVEPDDDTLEQLAREGVARILITNRNHTRAANRVRERTGARVAIHAADRAHAEAQGARIDAELAVGERVGPFRVVDAAGKSPGEIALHDADRGILVVGDAVIGNPPGQLSLLPEKVMDDPARLRASLRALAELEFEIAVLGDGVSIPAGARDRLRELVKSFPDA